MGVLTDIVIANESEAKAIATSSVPSREWPGIDAKGIDQVKLGTLWALLTGQDFKVESVVNEFVTLHEVSEDGPWVFRVPPQIVKLLADLDDERANTTALAWAATDEFVLAQWEGGAVRSILDELRSLARSANATSKSLLMWMSL
jgi:hypothetical protein